MSIIFFIVCVMLLGRVMWQSEFQMTKEQEGLLWENVEALGYSVYQSQQKKQMSDIALENVEALANDENSNTGTLYGNAAGTAFCCCPGSSRTCGASKCSNCI